MLIQLVPFRMSNRRRYYPKSKNWVWMLRFLAIIFIIALTIGALQVVGRGVPTYSAEDFTTVNVYWYNATSGSWVVKTSTATEVAEYIKVSSNVSDYAKITITYDFTFDDLTEDELYRLDIWFADESGTDFNTTGDYIEVRIHDGSNYVKLGKIYLNDLFVKHELPMDEDDIKQLTSNAHVNLDLIIFDENDKIANAFLKNEVYKIYTYFAQPVKQDVLYSFTGVSIASIITAFRKAFAGLMGSISALLAGIITPTGIAVLLTGIVALVIVLVLTDKKLRSKLL